MDIINSKETRPVETAGGEDLFRETMAEYRAAVAKAPEKADQRYGWTLFHSLPEEQRLRRRAELGLKLPEHASNHYNSGVLAASDGDWDTAVAEFKTAFDMNPELAPALYNWAVATEEKGDVAESCVLYLRFIDLAESTDSRADDVAKIKAHLDEMAS